MSGKMIGKRGMAAFVSELRAKETEALLERHPVLAVNYRAAFRIRDAALRERVQAAQIAHWKRVEGREVCAR